MLIYASIFLRLLSTGDSELDQSKPNKIVHIKNTLKKLGYSDVELNAIGDDEIYNTFKDASSISVTEEYLKIDKNGNKIALDKEECLNEIANAKNTTQLTSSLLLSNNASYTETSDDGYMKMLTASTYISSGYYNLSATYTWLDMPEFRMNDAFSIAAPECAWVAGSGAIYSNFSYSAFNYYGTLQNYQQIGSISVEQTGIYTIYSLPDDSFDPYYGTAFLLNSMVFYIRGQARVSDYTNPRAFNVYSRYEHTYSRLNFQPGFDWTTLGITATTNITNGSNSYTSYNLTNYIP